MSIFDHHSSSDSDFDEQAFVEMISKARSGDRLALGQLIDNYRNYLLLIANSEIDHRLQAKLGASDLVQQSMLQAQKHFAQFRGDTEPELQAWLRQILHNDLRKTRRTFSARKRNADQEVNLQENSAVERGLLDNHLTPSSEAIRRERMETLKSALESLPPDYQAVIRFRNFEQLSFAETGERMNRSADACRKLWSRAIQSLQSLLEQSSPGLLTGAHLPSVKPD